MRAKQELIEKHLQRPVRSAQGQTNAVYAAMIESMDESVGRVMRKLEALKLADNTLIIFTADNGGLSVREGPATPATSNAPLRAGKGYLYEGGIRVPLIVRWPAVVKPRSTCRTPVSSVDLFPTIAAAAGLPGDVPTTLDGVNLMPLLKGSQSLRRDALYWHYPHYSNQGGKPGGAIRSGPWKLIEFYEDNRVELYNLARDLGEKNNLAQARPEHAAALRNKLQEWRRAVDAQMMTPNPDYKAEP
jgi:arylsulfatase A-like enzyme